MLKKAKKIWQNEFFRGSLFFTLASFLTNILNYFFNFIAGRSLGPQGYSEITTLFSYMSITAVPTAVFSTFLIQKISSSEDNRFVLAHSMEQLLWQKIRRWWFVPLLSLSIIPFIPKITNLSVSAGTVLIPLILLSFIATFYGATMQGLKLFFLYSFISFIATFLKLLGAILSTRIFYKFNVIMFFIFLSVVIPLIIVFFILRSTLRKKVGAKTLKIDRRIVSLLFNVQFLLILFSTLALTLFNNIDIIFVKKFFISTDAGIYSSWSIFAKIIFYALGPLISISFIFFSGTKNKKSQNVALNIALLFLIFVAIGSFIVYKNFAGLVISALFGNKFFAVAPYLSLASIFGSLYAAIAFLNGYFLAKNDKTSLILPLLLPVYFIFLWFGEKKLLYVMNLDIFFSAVVTIFYVAVYLRSLAKKQ